MIARAPWPATQTAQFLCVSPPAWDWAESSWSQRGTLARGRGLTLWTVAESLAVRRFSPLGFLAGIYNIP